jgi:hypothetical protein
MARGCVCDEDVHHIFKVIYITPLRAWKRLNVSRDTPR